MTTGARGPAAPPTTTPPARRASRRQLWAVIVGAGIVVLALALVLLLVADSPGARLARAVDTTVAEGSARVVVTGTVADLPLLGDVELSVAEGELDFAGQAARLEREIPLLDVLPLPNATEFGTVELVFVGGRAWVRAPIGAERSWVRLGSEKEAADTSQTAPTLGNPLAILTVLRAVDTAPQEEGEEVVDGVATTRYRVEVDVDRVSERLETDTTWLERLGALHPDGVAPLAVWIDDEDRIRRVAYEGQLAIPQVTGLRLGTRVTLSDFGIPVSISAPHEDQTVEPSLDFLRGLDPLGWLRDLVTRLPGM